MFWDDLSVRDIEIYGIFVALGVLLLWNIILTIICIISLRRNSKYGRKKSNGSSTNRIATSPLWNQMYVPQIPRIQKERGAPSTTSSIPQSPSEWFGDGPDLMNEKIFF